MLCLQPWSQADNISSIYGQQSLPTLEPYRAIYPSLWAIVANYRLELWWSTAFCADLSSNPITLILYSLASGNLFHLNNLSVSWINLMQLKGTFKIGHHAQARPKGNMYMPVAAPTPIRTLRKWQMLHVYFSSWMGSDYSDTPLHPWDYR